MPRQAEIAHVCATERAALAPTVPLDLTAIVVLRRNSSHGSFLRSVAMDHQLRALKLPYVTVDTARHGPFDSYVTKIRLMQANLKAALRACSGPSVTSRLCAVLQDDAALHPRLEDELTATLGSLPRDWTVLNLCLGSVWKGTRCGGASLLRLNPERHLLAAASRAGGSRAVPLPEWPSQAAGGPVAFVLKRTYAHELLRAVSSRFAAGRHLTDDVVLRQAREATHFLAHRPPLCYEHEIELSGCPRTVVEHGRGGATRRAPATAVYTLPGRNLSCTADAAAHSEADVRASRSRHPPLPHPLSPRKKNARATVGPFRSRPPSILRARA